MSITDYEIRVYSPAGVEQGRLTGGYGSVNSTANSGFTSLAYSNRRNDVGWCKFNIHGEHTLATYLQSNDMAIVEVRRRNIGLGFDWYADFTGFARELNFNRKQTPVLEVNCLSTLHALQWRHVGYKTGVANRSSFSAVAAETALKNLVKYNCTSSGTTGDGRVRNATNAGALNSITVSIQADGAAGSAVTIAVFGDKVLEACQKVARVAGGDFDLIRTSTTAATFEFRWYLNQRGTDRSTTVLFAPDRGNVSNNNYRVQRVSQATAALTFGAGDETLRDVVVRTASNYSVTNDFETVVDARSGVSLGNTTALNARGDVALQQQLQRTLFSFQPLQIQSSAYGTHYFLGDKVKARDYGVTTTHLIDSVTVGVDSTGNESISMGLITL